jgi:hypothetical protein
MTDIRKGYSRAMHQVLRDKSVYTLAHGAKAYKQEGLARATKPTLSTPNREHMTRDANQRGKREK